MQPDGRLVIVYKDGEVDEFPFAVMCGLGWRWEESCDMLVIPHEAGRHEIPRENIRMLDIVNNSPEYVTYIEYQEQVRYVEAMRRELRAADAKLDLLRDQVYPSQPKLRSAKEEGNGEVRPA